MQYLTSIKQFFLRQLATNRRRTLCIFCLIVSFILFKLLVAWLAPAGYANAPCALSQPEINKMEKLLEKFVQVARAPENSFFHAARWWIDYGTLLGIVRSGTMVPHDKDIDCSILIEDMPLLRKLDPALKRAGLVRYGFTIVFKEDFLKVVKNDPELTAKIEFFQVKIFSDGRIMRPDAEFYYNASLGVNKILHPLDYVWWILLNWTGVSVSQRDSVFPLGNVTLKHLQVAAALTAAADSSSRKNTKKLDDENNNNNDNEKRQQHLHGDDDEEGGDWKIVLPAPKDPVQVVVDHYGMSWRVPIGWKPSCFGL